MSSRSRIITIIIILALTVYAGISLFNYWRLDAELDRATESLRKEVAELTQKIDDLKYMLDNIDHPDVKKRIAEEDLGFASPEELIINDGSGIQADD